MLSLKKTIRANIFSLFAVVVCTFLAVFIVHNTMEMIKQKASEYNESVALLASELIRTQEEPKRKPRVLILNTLNSDKVIRKVIRTGYVSSKYGYRRIFGRPHYGVDIAAPKGTPIYAYSNGKVVYAGQKGSYGLFIEIEHEDGIKTRYAHCSSIYYKSGDLVRQGEHIADVGTTGRSTGSHLHFELLVNGEPTDPANVFQNLGDDEYGKGI